MMSLTLKRALIKAGKKEEKIRVDFFFGLLQIRKIPAVLAVSHVDIVQRDTGACACLSGLGESEEFVGFKSGLHCSVHVS